MISPLAVAATASGHTTALRLLGVPSPLLGAVVTADAALTHADFAAEVPMQRGESVLYAKANQPGLHADLAAAGCSEASRRGCRRRCGTPRSRGCVGKTTPAWRRRPAEWPSQ